jgi:hypothetical protein
MPMQHWLGYILAGIHSVISLILLITPFVTQNIILLGSIFLIDLLTIISWRFFNDRCFLSIVEANFLDGVDNRVKNGKISYFNHKLAGIFGSSIAETLQRVRPYVMMCVCGGKILIQII